MSPIDSNQNQSAELKPLRTFPPGSLVRISGLLCRVAGTDAAGCVAVSGVAGRPLPCVYAAECLAEEVDPRAVGFDPQAAGAPGTGETIWFLFRGEEAATWWGAKPSTEALCQALGFGQWPPENDAAAMAVVDAIRGKAVSSFGSTWRLKRVPAGFANR